MVVGPVQRVKRKAILKFLRSILQAGRLQGHPPGLKWHRLVNHLVALKYHQNPLLDHLAALQHHQDPLSNHLVDLKYQQGPLLDHLAPLKCHLEGPLLDLLQALKCHLEGPLLDHLQALKCHLESPLLDHPAGARLDHRLGENKRMGKAGVAPNCLICLPL